MPTPGPLPEGGADGRAALDALTPLVYEQLRAVAVRLMAREAPGATLSPTGLLHEAWLRLAEGPARVQDRRHVLALAARRMRHLLVDQALARKAGKRGAGQRPLTLSAAELALSPGADPVDLLAVHEALQALEAEDARCARVVELRCFGGLTLDEIAQSLSLSRATVKREWVFGRAWLARALGAPLAPDAAAGTPCKVAE